MREPVRRADEDNVMPKNQKDKRGTDYMSDLGILSQVAQMYYNQGILQPEIARKLFFSRAKVSRILKKARQLGVVDIHVKRYLDRMPSIEQKMQRMFHLKEAIVLSNGDEEDEETLEGLTNIAALYVGDQLKNHCTMGITGGGTVHRIIQKLPKVEVSDMHVVQVIGASANQYIPGEARELVNHISTLLSANGHYLNTPLYIDDLYAKEILLRDPTVREVFDYMKHLDLLLTGIGSFNHGSTVPSWFGYMTSVHRAELDKLNAVGSICAQYFDSFGNRLDCEWNRKCVAIPFDVMKKAALTVGVAAGRHKAMPILGALRGEYINVLITDAETASLVIEQEEKSPRRPQHSIYENN